MRRFAILFVATAAAAVFTASACTTKGENSALVTTRVVSGVASGPADAGPGPASCKLDATGTSELAFISLGPDNFGTVGVGISNRIVDATQQNPLLRTNSSDFYANHAVVTYEVIGTGGTITANGTPPASGLVPQGGTGTVGVVLFPSRFSAAGAGIAAGTFIRATIRIEGKLLDGSTVKSSDREFLFQACGSAGCGNNPCL
jgi:hypothetical protein